MRATDLSARFEVTTRTIERDLLALQEAGVPIWAQPGPGGGYGLHAETTLPPLNLTPAEATAIATALAAAGAMPFAEAGRSALRKIAAAMANDSKESAARLVSQVRIVPDVAEPMRHSSAVIEQALIDGVALELHYRDGQERETRRVVEPAGVFRTPRGWYLAAWCRLRQAPRAFKLERVLDATLTEDAVEQRALDAVVADIPLLLVEPTIS